MAEHLFMPVRTSFHTVCLKHSPGTPTLTIHVPPTWYRFQITSVLSVLHRFTGIALAVGSILLAWWLVAVAAGGELFAATCAAQCQLCRAGNAGTATA